MSHFKIYNCDSQSMTVTILRISDSVQKKVINCDCSDTNSTFLDYKSIMCSIISQTKLDGNKGEEWNRTVKYILFFSVHAGMFARILEVKQCI